MALTVNDGFKAGSTSATIYVEIRQAADNLEKTGLIFSDITGSYVRSGGSRTAITMATLAAANSAWSSGGFKEVDATNQPGLYRFDVPDAVLATGVPLAVVSLKATGCYVRHVGIPLCVKTAADVFDEQYTNTDTEPASMPSHPCTPQAKIDWVFQQFRYLVTQTATQQKVYKADGTTVLGTRTVADDATTATKGAFA